MGVYVLLTERSRACSRSQPAARSAVPRAKPDNPEVRIFVSYSHRDADARQRLETHLAPLKREDVTTWFDGDMNVGDKLDTGIARALRNAHVFVALLSPDYLASNYCWKIEYKRAMGRRANGTMQVVAVVLRPCDWKSTTAAGFKLLPEDGKEVTRWRSADDAFLNVALGIRRVVAEIRKGMANTAGLARAGSANHMAGATRKRTPAKPKRPATPKGPVAASRGNGPEASGVSTGAKAGTVVRAGRPRSRKP